MIPVSAVAILAISCSAIVSILAWFIGSAQGRERALDDARAVYHPSIDEARTEGYTRGYQVGYRQGCTDTMDQLRKFLAETEDA